MKIYLSVIHLLQSILTHNLELIVLKTKTFLKCKHCKHKINNLSEIVNEHITIISISVVTKYGRGPNPAHQSN
jgi:hypothetical protein